MQALGHCNIIRLLMEELLNSLLCNKQRRCQMLFGMLLQAEHFPVLWLNLITVTLSYVQYHEGCWILWVVRKLCIALETYIKKAFCSMSYYNPLIFGALQDTWWFNRHTVQCYQVGVWCLQCLRCSVKLIYLLGAFYKPFEVKYNVEAPFLLLS